MVSVASQPEDVFSRRQVLLEQILRRGFDDAPAQVQGFVARALRNMDVLSISSKQILTCDACDAAARFHGYPALGRFGYVLALGGAEGTSSKFADRFLHWVEQQRCRPGTAQTQLGGDTLALLGLADGLRTISHLSQIDAKEVTSAKAWVQDLLNRFGGSDPLLTRARLLVADLLDDQGRFGQYLAQSNDTRSAALELCLYRTWPRELRGLQHPDTQVRRALFKKLIVDEPPSRGDLVQAVSWLCALDVLLDELAIAAVPDVSRVARILMDTQGSLRRWRWELAPTRKGVIAARWLIDKEPDVQSFLLAVLYPYFGMQLEDEQYLRGFGLRQGRFDFAITSLGLIVEVKMLRTSSDLGRVESEIADDLSLYFKQGNPFTHMIVYIYDDRDKPEPEKYPLIRDALLRRNERIVSVVIIQRPSMIPNQSARGGKAVGAGSHSKLMRRAQQKPGRRALCK